MKADGVGLPFVTALDEHVEADRWSLCNEEGERIAFVKKILTTFDPAAKVVFSRSLTVNLSELRKHCRLDSRDQLLLTVVVWSKDARKRYLACDPVRLGSESPDVVNLELDATIDGSFISGDFDLMTEIVIDAPIHSEDIFAASIPGNVLWYDHLNVEVEGQAAQFPIHSGQFSKMPWIGAEAAPWHLELEVGAGVEEPFASVVRLFINSEKKAMRNYQGRPEISQMIKYDVARSLLSTYLRNEEFHEIEPESNPRSLGSVVVLMTRMIFPGYEMKELVDFLNTYPGRFDSRIRAHTGLLDD